MSIEYGQYAGWTAKDLLKGKGSTPSPFPDGKPPGDWDWQNFLNYGGDGQAREQLVAGLKLEAAPEVKLGKKHEPKVIGKAKPLKRKVAPVAKKKAKK